MIHEVNINRYCYVRLTEFGKKVLDYEKQRCEACMQTFLLPTSTDLGLQFQFWDLMRIFGQAHMHGADPCFENNSIVFAL